MKLTVKVPPGAKPGKTKMNVPYGNGQSVEVIVPPKAKIGKTFVVEVPDPAPQPQAITPTIVQAMPAPQEMSVQVPEGLASGQQFTVAAPDGQQISVTVPPGVAGGAVIQVQCPPAVQQVQAQGVQVVVVEQPGGEPQGTTIGPYEAGRWKFDIFDFGRCFSCKGDCLMAWCCQCFPVAQIAGKLMKRGVPSSQACGGYYVVLPIFFVAIILDMVFSAMNIPFSYFRVIVACVFLTFLRGALRKQNSIPGSSVEDCLYSWCCSPCTITQMVGQMWKVPDRHPGCEFDDKVCEYA